MIANPAFAAQQGVLRLPRRDLEAVVNDARDVYDPACERGRRLRELGVIEHGRLHPSVRGTVATLRDPRRRFVVRIDGASGVELRRGWVGESGVVTVTAAPGGTDLHDVREVPRPTATAHVLAGLLELGPGAPVVGLPEATLSWRSVVRPLRDSDDRGWAEGVFAPTTALRLFCLRWSTDRLRPPSTVLALLSGEGTGLVEVTRRAGGFRLVARQAGTVWARLCALAAP